MAFEFKKLSDVNSIEAMKEGLNILAEDNGEIVKVQTPYYGTTIQFIDGSALIPGMLTYQAPYTMAEIVDRLRNAVNEKVEFIRLNFNANGPSTTLYQTGFELIDLGEGNYNARVYFGEDICPIILDTVENKMIFDPDWTAPAESIPVPMTAEVGQVVAVKAVDENGKPTEWEAVNVGSGYDMVIVASEEVTTADNKSILSIESGTCADILTAVKSGRKPRVLLKQIIDYIDYVDYDFTEAVWMRVSDTSAAGEIGARFIFTVRHLGKFTSLEIEVYDGYIYDNDIKDVIFDGEKSWS